MSGNVFFNPIPSHFQWFIPTPNPRFSLALFPFPCHTRWTLYGSLTLEMISLVDLACCPNHSQQWYQQCRTEVQLRLATSGPPSLVQSHPRTWLSGRRSSSTKVTYSSDDACESTWIDRVEDGQRMRATADGRRFPVDRERPAAARRRPTLLLETRSLLRGPTLNWTPAGLPAWTWRRPVAASPLAASALSWPVCSVPSQLVVVTFPGRET